MNNHLPILYWLGSGIVITIFFVLVSYGQLRNKAQSLLLCIASVLVLYSFLVLASGGTKLAKANNDLKVKKAEMQLNLEMALKTGFDRLKPDFGKQREASESFTKPISISAATYSLAEQSIRKALKEQQDSYLLKAKLIILLETKGSSSSAEAVKLAFELSQALHSPAKVLGLALLKTYAGTPLDAKETLRLLDVYRASIPAGWFRDNLISSLYKVSAKNAPAQLKSCLAQAELKYWRMFVKFLLCVGIAFASTMIGILVVIAQLCLLARKGEKGHPAVIEDTGLPVSLKTVYVVFVTSLSCQILIGLALQHIFKSFPSSGAVSSALYIACSYLAGNGPALYFMYCFALRPQGLGFKQALKITSPKSPIELAKLGLAGYFAWCAMFVLVIPSAVFANKFCGSEGSDSPILTQIITAATSSNTLAPLIFYLTVGLFAPFCEEALFRGFLYRTLKHHMGLPLAMLLSTSLFALLHFDKGGLLMLFAIGFVLTFVFEKTNNLIAAMIAHGLWNSGAFTIALILFSIN